MGHRHKWESINYKVIRKVIGKYHYNFTVKEDFLDRMQKTQTTIEKN